MLLRTADSCGCWATCLTCLCHASPGCVQVVRAASERGRDHVPYRSSKLTHVLKDSLGGNCATVLIANVWGEPAQLDETLSTCRWEGWGEAAG